MRVLIVDDEPPARKKLAEFLRRERDVEIAGEAANGTQAAELIEELQPDVVFLDIQMPGMSGFEVLETIHGPIPFVVFVTAYDQYAVKAFEVHAVDYLLKPFDRNRLQACLSRVRDQIGRDSGRDIQVRMEKLIAEATGRAYLTRVMVKNKGRVIFLQVRDIDWIKALSNYVELHAGAQTYLLRDTLSSLEARLDPASFARVHRSVIVNRDRIRELQPWSHNDYLLVMKDGTEIRMSRRYHKNL
ncbi:MAG TPA: LytTR family DNA-binding domain-containing protein [Terriglobia bacterium]|nr:LytTR family DNA-binding domain-containing protein [Terriglobia bacterium]